jgi:hypothetical protein
MSNEIRSIASVRGLFGRECVHLYNEKDLLQQNGTWGIDGCGVYVDGFLYEEFIVRHIEQYKIGIGLCVNSFPFFCRMEKRAEAYGLMLDAYHISTQKNRKEYEQTCPKCGWGVSAYLAIRCRHDARWGVRYYDRQGNETNQRTTFEAYLNICRTIYKAIHQDEYTHYKAIGDVEALNRLEADFISQHRKAEEQNRNISGEVDRLFFGGQLAKVVGEYLDYVSGVEAGGHQEGQQADRWVIDADVTLRVFRGDRTKAVAYLSEVVGHGYSAMEYGKETKRLKIDIPFGYGKLFWKMICANDTSQTDKGYSTFNKGRS